ncbi:hypothetical protein EV356DRAFT_566389, partial [Viridothelium virens]
MSSGSYVSTKPRVDRRFFLAFMWGGAAISSLFVFARLAIRLKAFRRLYSDDGLVVLAWISSLGACVLWQMVVDDLYNQYKLSTGQLALTPDVIKGEKNLLRGTLAYLIFFHTCIYSIKGSFLLFFRRLDSKAQGFRKRWWWFVAIITLAGYLSSCGTIQWKCLLSSLDYIFTQCSKEAAIKYEHSTFSYQCAIDVITDTLIISIPIIMLWNVKVALRKKVALIALFSLTVIVIGISITRVSVVPTMSAQADVSWLYFWHNLEVPVSKCLVMTNSNLAAAMVLAKTHVALIVSSLASFR